MNSLLNKSNSKTDSIECQQRLESFPHFYECVKQIQSNDDLFVAKYIPTGDNYGLRRTNLEAVDKLEFVVNEIKLTRLLKHKNLMPILCSFVSGLELWTITPLAHFGSASDISKPHGLPEVAIAFIVRDVLSGLVYLHKRGIIHRSVRGSHILITAPNGRCLLSGLKHSTSCTIDGKWQTAIHQYPSRAESNLNWLAPEVLEQNLLGYNAKSDIYSLGITLCELSNGCVPYEDVQLTEMLLDKLTGQFPRPLDSTCQEIANLCAEDMSPEIRDKYETFRNRRFSSSFHKFVIDLCLNFDQFERPSASQLLAHSFLKQVKKCSHNNLISVVPDIKPLNCVEINKNNIGINGSDKYGLEDNVSKLSSDESYVWNFS